LLPFYGVAVLLAGRFGRGADSCEGEVWVEGEEEDEALTDATCGSEDT